jgi:protein-arginine kinase activator protein McsA
MKQTPKKAAKETDKKAKVKIGTVESDLKKLSLAELQKQLNDVLESEDYIKAAHIRDEINSRK